MLSLLYNRLMLKWLKLHWLKTLLLTIGIAILGASFFLVRPDTFLPHKRIVIHAPYDLNSPPINLIPMGEKIYHPNAPGGHPGIDFQWSGPDGNVLSSSNGVISSIGLVTDKWPKWEIDVSSWPYIIRYKEMETYNTNLKKGSHVKVGDFLGHPANPKLHNEVGGYQIHWEFGTPSIITDRLCPMTYFDEASRKSVQAIYDSSTWQYKSQYPDVCSGSYKNKTE